jgi:hypothetical protein
LPVCQNTQQGKQGRIAEITLGEERQGIGDSDKGIIATGDKKGQRLKEERG